LKLLLNFATANWYSELKPMEGVATELSANNSRLV